MFVLSPPEASPRRVILPTYLVEAEKEGFEPSMEEFTPITP
jgi:hypothetical protein